jgi:hypothetical protein
MVGTEVPFGPGTRTNRRFESKTENMTSHDVTTNNSLLVFEAFVVRA